MLEPPAEELRRRFPLLAGCVDDFYEMRACNRSFDWAQQSEGWRQAQRILSREYLKQSTAVDMETLKEMVKLRAALRF